ncbi:MAG: bacterial Ig-like domain-containing protein [Bacillota bacterium]
MKKKLIAIVLILLMVFAVGLVACDTDKEVASMSLYTSPQTTYVLGESLNIDGASLEVKYGDGSEAVIALDSSMISTFDNSKLGNQILTITYNSTKISFVVTVIRPDIEEINFVAPTKTDYVLEQNFSTEGGYFEIIYVDGTTENVALTADMCSGYDIYTMGEQTVTAILTGYSVVGTSTFTINVDNKSITSIEVNTVPTKSIYYLGDTTDLLDLTGGVIRINYDNGYNDKVSMLDTDGNLYSGLTITAWDTSVTSNYSYVTIEYKGFTTKFAVQVTIKDVYTVDSISEAGDQLVGTALDLSALALTVTYNDYVTKETIYGDNSELISASGYDIDAVGYQTITLTFYSGGVALATTYDIEVYVQEKTISNFSIIQANDAYYQDTAIDMLTWQYIIEYNNGTSEDPQYLNTTMLKLVDSTESIKDGIVTYLTAGQKTISITYRGSTSNYTFEVSALEVASITVTPNADAVYYRYHDFDVTGITYSVLYNSGNYKTDSTGSTEFALTADMVSGYNSNSVGTQTLFVTYSDSYSTGVATTLSITIVKEVTDALGVSSEVSKTSYILGEDFDTTGLAITIKYVGEEDAELVSDFANLGSEWIFTCDAWAEGTRTFAEVGTYEVYVTYSGISDPVNNGIYISVDVHNELSAIATSADLASIYAGSSLSLADTEFLLTYEDNLTITLSYEELIALGTLSNDYNKSNLQTDYREVVFTFIENDSTNTITFAAYVSISESTASYIDIVSYPTKLEYVVGDSSGLDTTGLEMNLVYTNGTTKTLAVSDCTISGFNANVVADEVTITITKDVSGLECAATYAIKIVTATIVSMTWASSAPEITITEGLAITAATPAEDGVAIGLYEVKLTMSDGDTDTDTYSINYLIEEGYDIAIAEDYNSFSTSASYITVEVTYGSLILDMYVKTNARTLSGIEVYYTDGAEYISIIEDTAFDFSDGLVLLRLTYNNGTTKDIAMSADYISGYESKVNATDEITITYEKETCTTDVYTNAKELVEIAIYTYPKQKYMEGELFDADAMSEGSIALIYNNGSQEIVSFSEASINNATADFNINAVRFNSTEFTGTTKVQPIYVTYSGLTTSFNVYVYDRNYITASYKDTSSIYTYTYGQTYEINVTLTGYTYYNSGVMQVIDSSLVTIAYVPYAEKDNYIDYTEYTEQPTDVGTYIIVVIYNADSYGDLVHNYFIDSSKTLVIEKKVIYVEVQDATNIYGSAENATLYIIVYGADENGNKDATVGAFAYYESFATNGLFTGSSDTTTYCYIVDGDGTVISLFTFTFYNGGSVITMDGTTNVGAYIVSASGASSDNYDIKYISGAYTVTARQVILTPESKSVTYGEDVGVISYKTSEVEGTTESGLVEGETLGGLLSRESGNNVGTYAITIGTVQLANTNYDILFNNTTENTTEYVSITITVRTIYVQATSVIMVYGDSLPTLTVSYYNDKACTNSADAFAATDSYLVLGNITYDMGGLELNSDIGTYTIMPSYEGNANYNIEYISGTVTVTQRDLYVVADPLTKVFGDADPDYTYAFNYASAMGGSEGSGAVITSIVYDIDGNIAKINYDDIDITLTRIAGEYVDTYTISVSDSNVSNYNIIFTSAKLTIVQKELVVSIDSEYLSKTFDGKEGSISTDDLTVTFVNGNNEDEDDFDLSGIVVTVVNASRNTGSYTLSVLHTSNDYSVSFNETYIYTINQKEVEIDYLINQTIAELSDSLVIEAGEYSGSYYSITAQVAAGSLQYYYNSDGTIRTDEYGNYVTDTVTITLSLSSILNAGQYTVTPVAIGNTNNNYKLSDTAWQSISVIIAQRELQVELVTDDGGSDYYQVYNGVAVELYEGDFIVNNTIDGENVYVSVTVNPSGTAPSDVLYDDNGNIIGYDIEANEVNNANYTVVMKEEDYKVIITPEYVTISIIESLLTKTYDTFGPTVSGGIIYSSNNLLTSDLLFTFTRNSSDGLDNTAVGSYSVAVSTLSSNYVVSLAESYLYTITQAIVTIKISTEALSKTYDEEAAYIDPSYITLTGNQGTKANMHTFASTDAYDEFSGVMYDLQTLSATLVTELTTLLSYASSMTTDKLSTLQSLLDNIQDGSYAALQKYIITTEHDLISSIFVASNYDSLVALLSNDGTLAALFSSLKTAISYGGDADLAEIYEDIENLYAYALTAAATIDTEDTYIAFVMQVENDDAIDAGTYTFKVVTSDINKKYVVSNSSLTYKILAKAVYIKVFDDTADADSEDSIEAFTMVYGDALTHSFSIKIYEDIYYENEIEISEDDFYATASILNGSYNSYDYLGAGTYSIGITVVKNSANTTYYYVTQDFKVEQKEMTVTVTDEAYEFTYGDSINIANLTKYYSYDADAFVNGDSDSSITEPTSSSYWTLHTTATDYNGDYLKAGEYRLSVTGFTSKNYSLTYVDGSIVVAKKELELITSSVANISDNVLTRTYGEAFVPSYNGFVGDENATEVGLDGSEITTSETGYLADLKTDVTAYSGSYYKVEIALDDDVLLDNYEIVLEGDKDESYYDNVYTYYLNIVAKDMYIVFKDIDGSDSLTATYGEIPDYTISFAGLYTEADDYDELLAYGTTLTKDEDEVYISIDFKRDVNDSGYFGADDNKVIWTDKLTDKFYNYNIKVQAVWYDVTPREITVGLDKDLYTVYDDGVSISLYSFSLYNTSTSESEEGEQYMVFEGGDYSWYNFVIGGSGYADGETMADVFNTYSSDSSYTNDDGETCYYADYTITPIHTLYVSDCEIGTNTVQLTEFSTNDNYKVTGDYVKVVVYGDAASLSQASDNIMLAGDASSVEGMLEDLEITVTYEDGTKDTFSVSTNGEIKLADSSKLSYNTTNINQTITVTYSVEYEIADDMAGSKFYAKYGGGENDITINNTTYSVESWDTSDTNFDDKLSLDIIVRIYSKETISVDTGVDAENLPTTDETAIQYKESAAGSYNYDEINTTVRMVPSADEMTYTLTINSSVKESVAAAGNYTMQFVAVSGASGGTYLYVYTKKDDFSSDTSYDSTAENLFRIYELDFGDIDLFDGFTHKIYVHYDKRLGTVLISIDGVAYYQTLITTTYGEVEEVTNEDKTTTTLNILYAYVAQEASYAGYSVSGGTVWVAKFETNLVGYSDNYATYVRAAAQIENIVFGVADYSSTLPLDIRYLFDTYEPSGEDYIAYYYVDGSDKKACTSNSSESEKEIKFDIGYHTVTMIIYDENSNMVSQATISFYVTANQSLKIYAGSDGSTGTLVGNDNNYYVSQSNVITLGGAGKYNYYTSSAEDVTSVSVSFTFSQVNTSSLSATKITLLKVDEKNYIDLIIAYNGSSYSNNYLCVTIDGTSYTTSNGTSGLDIAWLDGSLYNVSLYLDYITLNDDAYGTRGFQIVITDDGEIVKTITNSDFKYEVGINDENGSTTYTATTLDVGTLSKLTENASTSKATYFYVEDAYLNLYELEYNDSSSIYRNYYNMSDGKMSMGGEAITVASGNEIAIADGNGNPLLSATNSVTYTFAATEFTYGTINMFASQSNSSTTQESRGNGYGLVFTKSTDGTTRLYFQFFSGSTMYAIQNVSTTIDLLDGKEHTITIEVDRSVTNASGGITNFAYNTVTYNKVYITIDGVSLTWWLSDTIERGYWYLPSSANLDYWYNVDEEYTTGTDSTVVSFMPVFTYTSFAFTANDTTDANNTTDDDGTTEVTIELSSMISSI